MTISFLRRTLHGVVVVVVVVVTTTTITIQINYVIITVQVTESHWCVYFFASTRMKTRLKFSDWDHVT
jgi:hypothetical protein